MAYNVYALCDMCGDTIINFTNTSVSMTKMRKIAKSQGWDVSNGWICPNCRKLLPAKRSSQGKPDIQDIR